MSEELRTILQTLDARETEAPEVLANLLRAAVFILEEALHPQVASSRDDSLAAYAELAATSKMWTAACPAEACGAGATVWELRRFRVACGAVEVSDG